MTAVAGLVRSFAALLRPAAGNAELLTSWIAEVRAEDLPHLHAFTRGLDQDRDAVNAALTHVYHNGGTEGVNTKPKLIKRQMYGRAGFSGSSNLVGVNRDRRRSARRWRVIRETRTRPRALARPDPVRSRLEFTLSLIVDSDELS